MPSSNQESLAKLLKPGTQRLGWFSQLEKKNIYPHIHIYNFFVFTFKYKNTILLCVINGGPRNKLFLPSR